MITLTFCVCPLANNFEKEELSDISVFRPEKTDEFVEHNSVVAAEDGWGKGGEGSREGARGEDPCKRPHCMRSGPLPDVQDSTVPIAVQGKEGRMRKGGHTWWNTWVQGDS